MPMTPNRTGGVDYTRKIALDLEAARDRRLQREANATAAAETEIEASAPMSARYGKQALSRNKGGVDWTGMQREQLARERARQDDVRLRRDELLEGPEIIYTPMGEDEPHLIYCACHSGCLGSASPIGHRCGCPR
jgi:hypothetical protein